jgi:hypothetical protein
VNSLAMSLQKWLAEWLAVAKLSIVRSEDKDISGCSIAIVLLNISCSECPLFRWDNVSD